MRKLYTLYIAVIIIGILSSLVYISKNNNASVSALSYESSVGIGFTFNPTLSVSLSSNDLVIANLTPGSSDNSNSINVSVATNASYGYTLSAIAGDSTHNNSNLTHSNNTDIFSSIATNADLANLDDSEDNNIWGYTTSLDNGSTWSNYNGLSSSISTTLLDTNSNNTLNNGVDSIGFKIGAKAGNTQASGTYTNTINFIAVSKVAPMSLLDSFIASGAEQLNGYYKMQDMTHDICNNVDIEESELQLIDIRDNKTYWVAKLKDGNCWMTQNLDLDLDSNTTYTHWDTDLGWTTLDENASWRLSEGHSTIDFTGSTVDNWVDSNTEPYSANPGNVYYYTSNSTSNDIQYDSLQGCTNAGHIDCTHYHAGNYYNWTATIASNDSSGVNTDKNRAPNSICPKNWRLPNTSSIDNEYNELGKLFYKSNIISRPSSHTGLIQYQTGGFNKLRSNPYYFIRSGYISIDSLRYNKADGDYWSGIVNSESYAYALFFGSSDMWPAIHHGTYGVRSNGISLRCITR